MPASYAPNNNWQAVLTICLASSTGHLLPGIFYRKKLDRFDVLILDDIGYVQQSREEMEVVNFHPLVVF